MKQTPHSTVYTFEAVLLFCEGSLPAKRTKKQNRKALKELAKHLASFVRNLIDSVFPVFQDVVPATSGLKKKQVTLSKSQKGG